MGRKTAKMRDGLMLCHAEMPSAGVEGREVQLWGEAAARRSDEHRQAGRQAAAQLASPEVGQTGRQAVAAQPAPPASSPASNSPTVAAVVPEM